MVGSSEWLRRTGPFLALAAGATVCAIALPPLVAFESQRLPALLLVAVGIALYVGARFWRAKAGETRLAPTLIAARIRRAKTGETRLAPTSLFRPALIRTRAGGFCGRRPSGAVSTAGTAAGEFILWAMIAWCVFSQEAPVPASVVREWSVRALPLAVLLAIWLWLRLPRDWQRRALLGVTLPTIVALGFAALPAAPHEDHFSPYYLALDSSGTLYASDAHAAVIRVFAPGGALVAKLRPGLASRQGPPGPGFSLPGPYNDPDGLGVARATPGKSGITVPLQPWPVGADDFWFCGMAVGPRNRLFVPDWMRGRLLRFAPDGHLEVSLPLPAGYQPSLGCVTATASALYLADTRGTVLQIDPATGHTLATSSLGEPILGGISAAPSGAVYALARARVYQLDASAWLASTGRGRATPLQWSLPAPSGALSEPYQAILATGDGRVLVANLASRCADIYSATGKALGTLGGPGSMPGQFGQVGGLASDATGALYVADSDSRAVQRFTAQGHINALYWSPDDDEIE